MSWTVVDFKEYGRHIFSIIRHPSGALREYYFGSSRRESVSDCRRNFGLRATEG
jgi:hypothetical protein